MTTNNPRLTSPRQFRALMALLKKPQYREHIDRVAGASNGPQVVSELRDKGLFINCSLIAKRDRDGKTCRVGLYHLAKNSTVKARQMVADYVQRNSVEA